MESWEKAQVMIKLEVRIEVIQTPKCSGFCTQAAWFSSLGKVKGSFRPAHLARTGATR